MFNPKENLLDRQLSESGLELQILDLLTGGAHSRNEQAKKAEKEQRKYNEEVAELTNEHNDKLDAADQANYYAMRDYSHENAVKNFQRGAEIQDFQYVQSLKEYQKSTTLGNEQLGLNAQGEAQAIAEEQAVISEAFIQQQFQHRQSMDALKQTYVEQNINRQEQFQQLQGIRSRKEFGSLEFQNTVDQLMTQGAMAKEAEMVKNLVAEGAILASGQAGGSTAKAVQSNKASLHRGLMALESELSGKYKQAAIQLAELNADASLQEAGVGLNLQRIDAAIKNAEKDTQYNLNVMSENMKSAISQAERNIKQIGLERQIKDVNTRAGMMLFPERLSYDPAPEMPPEHIFVERMEVIPGFVPPAQQENLWAAGLSTVGTAVAAGFSAGAGALAAGARAGTGLATNIGIATGVGTLFK